MTTTCGACRHFRPTTDLNVGECWRYPPTAVPLQQNPVGGIGAASIHPPVKRQDSCGEWAAQPLDLAEPIR